MCTLCTCVYVFCACVLCVKVHCFYPRLFIFLEMFYSTDYHYTPMFLACLFSGYIVLCQCPSTRYFILFFFLSSSILDVFKLISYGCQLLSLLVINCALIYEITHRWIRIWMRTCPCTCIYHILHDYISCHWDEVFLLNCFYKFLPSTFIF